jgi:hypothetical protein
MKKVLMIVALATAMTVQAETWVKVSESNQAPLFVDLDSFTAGRLDDGSPFIGSTFKTAENTSPDVNVVFLTTPQSCESPKGQMVERKMKNGDWITTNDYIWTAGGKQQHDVAGGILCAILKSKSGAPKSDTEEKRFDKGFNKDTYI